MQTEGEGAVPGLAVVLAFVLVIISIMVLVWYVNHIGRKLRVSALIELVGSDTRKLLDKLMQIRCNSALRRINNLRVTLRGNRSDRSSSTRANCPSRKLRTGA